MPNPPGRACQEGGECVSKAFHKNKYSESVLGPIGKRREIDSGYDLRFEAMSYNIISKQPKVT